MTIIRLSIIVIFGFLTSNAFADAAGAGSKGVAGGLMSILPMIILLVAFMYFMIIRPQSKRSKEHKGLMDSLKKGDEVVTIGGLLGKIENIADDFLVVGLSENNSVTIQKSAVANVVPKGTMKTVK